MNHSRRAALERSNSDSLFPPEEAGSFNSRATPVVPASEELKALGTRSLPPGLSELVPSASSRPTASFGPANELAHAFYEQAPKSEVPSLAPSIAPRVPRSRGRAIAAKLLFVTLFAAVATLLGFALKKKLDASGRASDAAGFFAAAR